MKLSSLIVATFLGAALAGSAFAADLVLELEVDAGKHARKNTPVTMLVELPEALADATTAKLSGPNGKTQVGQLNAPRLLAQKQEAGAGKTLRELTFIVEELPASEKAKYTAAISPEAAKESFAWHDTPGVYNELRLGDKPVLRYMYEPIDESNGAARERTFKPYHQVYNPAGSAIVTKGPGGLFPHHRGIYYGFMNCRYGDKNQHADTWHCKDGAFQSHEDFLAAAVGPVLGRHVVEIDWHGKKKDVFAKEQREVTVYNTPGGNLIEFASKLKGTQGKLKVDGDPQHAGFQFRAAQEVADKTAKQTYYVRPDGADKPGSFRNWPDKRQTNLPWNALSFVVGGQRYTAAYLDSPHNPKEARYSERDYGRFGSYFVKEVPEGETLDVNYRIWLQDGEMTPEQIAALSADFVEPPTVTVTKK